ncbi:MAG: 5-formyltetrahydrofolate cyclo-ligase, partial [Actinomycetota bacterium]|nr:5-formyltetrahydrofolate cyclo-ligase [Actinomycetota bacterium]
MASDQPGLADAKASLRRRVRAARAARPPGQRRVAESGLAARAVDLLPQSAARIACYVSLAAEPGTALLIAGMLASGHRVWVPRIEGASLAWVETGPGTDYRTGPMGIAEPAGEADGDLAGMAVILMPATAVDGQGNRLGQGGGFYDRALAT